MKQLPLGKQTFSKIIESNSLYVDKTELIYKLLSSNLEYVFLSRPRRFGKSLLVSTLEEIFSGNQELFKGLYIYDKIDWVKYPVIKISFAQKATDNAIDFANSILFEIETICQRNEIINDKKTVSDSFRKLILSLYNKYKLPVVILIDEYDKPINSNFDNIELTEELKKVMKAFYSVIKDNDQYIRFMFVTGVSKLAKVSLFSELNQMTDISLNDKYAVLLGLTEDELTEYFEDYFLELERTFNISREEVRSTLKKWYNGYSWDGKNFLYNPFSILSALESKNIFNFWFESGTSKPLMEQIVKDKISVEEINNNIQSAIMFEGTEITGMSLIGLMFQTGYQTIKSITVRGMEKTYLLDYPNHEVKESLFRHISAYILNKDTATVESNSIRMRNALEEEEIEKFMNHLRSVFANIPSLLYIPEEKYFHSLFITIMYLIGVDIKSEVNTNIGRIDGVIEYSDKIYIIEFKYKIPASEGLKQIKEKKYYEKYLSTGKKIILLGVSFTREKIEYAMEE